MYYVIISLYILSCIILILFVLLQPGKSDAAAVFGGGGANSSAFGPRGTQTVLAKITIGAAIVFFLTAFLFSIPGLFASRSVGEGVGPAVQTPISPENPVQTPATPEQPPAAPANQVAPSTGSSEAKPATPNPPKPDEKKPEEKK